MKKIFIWNERGFLLATLRFRVIRQVVLSGQGWTGPLGPLSRRSDCMMANVVV
jgi:hypothetical protein